MHRIFCAMLMMVLFVVDADARSDGRASFSSSRSSPSFRSSSSSLSLRSGASTPSTPVVVAPLGSNRSSAPVTVDPTYSRRTGPSSSLKSEGNRSNDSRSLYQRYQSSVNPPSNAPAAVRDVPNIRRPLATPEETAKYRRPADRSSWGYSGNQYPSYSRNAPSRSSGFSWGSAAAGAAAGWLVSSLLNHSASASELEEYRRHYNDPEVRAWREEQLAKAESDSELKRKLDELEGRVSNTKSVPRPQELPVAKVCAGLPQGAYTQVAHLLNDSVAVEVMQTSGSIENVQAVRDGRCDIGFAQRDVVVSETGQQLKASSDFMLEALMLICQRQQAPASLADLPRGMRVALAEQSGAEATWNILSERLPHLREINLVRSVTPSEAVALSSSGPADCAFLVTHPDSGMAGFADLDDRLRLVPIREADFEPMASHSEWKHLYLPVSIAGRRFKHLAAAPWTDGYAVETVLLVNEAWQKEHLPAYDRILHAMAKIRTRMEGQP